VARPLQESGQAITKSSQAITRKWPDYLTWASGPLKVEGRPLKVEGQATEWVAGPSEITCS